MANVAPRIENLFQASINVLKYPIIRVDPVGDTWTDDHILCRQVRVTTIIGNIDISLWWCGEVAHLVQVANESPTAMAAVLHVIYSELLDRAESTV